MPEGSVALVTGAARGIGASVAQRLAQEGHVIAALDVRDATETVEAIRASGGQAKAYRCDVARWEEVRAAVDDVEHDLGELAVVASVAGVWEHVPFLELDPAAWHRLMDVNLEGTFNVCRLGAAPMARRGRGAIVCISSNAAFMAWDGGVHYSASKAGIVGLVKGMAFELGRHGIRANAVCPGTVRTPASAQELEDPVALDVQVRACPIGRIGEPGDIAEAVAFLADPVRAAWMTGEAILVDGGFGTHGEGADFGTESDSVVTA